ncbi:MAG: hypothetical protein IPL79_10920 [Myxococcales bacterium]|nr:hypothetical protein [Myxococcales bacterium]
MRHCLALSMIAALLASLACGKNPYIAEVGGAILPEADRASDVPGGLSVIVVKTTTDEKKLQLTAGPARVAIDRGVSWVRVLPFLQRLKAAGVKPVFLTGYRDEARAFVPTDVISDKPPITIDVNRAGDFCISPPTGFYDIPVAIGEPAKGENIESICIETDMISISRANVREAMREAIKQYGVTEVMIRMDEQAAWLDMVKAVDGVRTCCGKTAMKAAVAGMPTF